MLKRVKDFIWRRKSESGRSMVEILGVLAVIGVLTVGGLTGYNYAITKYRANEILNEINSRLVVAEQQITLGTPLNMSEFEDTILGKYKIDVYQPEGGGRMVAMELSNIPVDVAKQLFNSSSGLWKLPMVYFNIEAQPEVVASNGFSYPELIASAKADSATWGGVAGGVAVGAVCATAPVSAPVLLVGIGVGVIVVGITVIFSI